MKTKVAMAISLAGVLAAGTAAALVNTQVLNGGSSGAAVLDAAQVTDPPRSGSAAPSDTTVAAQPGATPNSPRQAMYPVGEAGTVTLDTSDSSLKIVAVNPAPGWSTVEAESNGVHAEVKLQSNTAEVEFRANLLYGVVTAAVETHDVSGDDASVSGGEGDDDGFVGSVPQRNDDDGGDDD
jgi:hypothetical protein